MGKKGSWKWKLSVVILIACICLMVMVFSTGGQEWARAKVFEKFQELPPAEQRDSPWADRWLALAWWRSNILMDPEAGMEMYREFCGLPKDRKAQSNNIVYARGDLDSPLCSKNGATGWGPMHPRAPEAYYNYLEMVDIADSSQFTHNECENYYRLFYTWMRRNSPDHKVHPDFNKYWKKVMILGTKRRQFPWSPDIETRAPLAPPAPAE